MIPECVEDYLGAIYRLRTSATSPVPLSRLVEYFGFSPVSIHEMIKKLSQKGWLIYYPYRGVTLTEKGEDVAGALIRRHRLWERFLTDMLDISWDQAHEIAGDLEHAAPELVTERLAKLLGDPERCPHGDPIPPLAAALTDHCLSGLAVGTHGRVARISPETGELLRQVKQWGMLPGCSVRVLEQGNAATVVEIEGVEIRISAARARAIWVELL